MNLAREPVRRLLSPWNTQMRAGTRLMLALENYAREIGCSVVGDSIESNDEQARKLAAWWMENTK